MKNKGNAFIAGLMLTMPIVAGAQQTEPLTGHSRLFDDGKQLFMRHDYAAARQTLMRYMDKAKCAEFTDEAEYMLVCTAYELQMPDRIEKLEAYLEKHPESRYISNWQPDMIYFDNNNVRASESYKMQKMFGQHAGDLYISSVLSLPDALKKYVGTSVVKDSKSGKTWLKVVNALPRTLKLSVSGLGNKQVTIAGRSAQVFEL